ncbi:allophanate hydrolase [Azospirillum rugosum]|uniref:Allophanate hydrolase n=1 Tax=Azospirillum rugosum TaxID=416170 RepID=A0ABS4SJY8_9PROT|nr:allophanate hydrolase [Azospirillum rugosum]MBP2292812.1 allophanate hydrolase [Azospirillum rugosum]MDQ0527071.1 allophanate hydrolase [Azospirillum rugosum]
MNTMSLEIAALAKGYAEGSLTPDAVLDAVYARINERGERPVWIHVLSRAEAGRQLEAAQARKAAGADLPLFGIPFAVKDNIDVAGVPTTAGCPDFAYTPDRSATVVQRLLDAGAILIGKTNLDQFATGLVGTRTPYGIPSSVFDERYVSGGSSSGSGVAVGAGLVSFALGTDTAGSGRVPAAFNNVVGLKPTKGLVSASGVVPACRTQDVVSIFAGTAGDALAVLKVMGTFDPADPYSRKAPAAATEPAAWPLGFRFGVPRDGLEFFGDEAAARLYAAAADRLEALGGTRVPVDFTSFRDAAQLLYSGPWVAERLAAIRDFAKASPEAIHPVVRGIVLGAEAIGAVDAFAGMYRLAELIRRGEAEWARMDVLLLPTTGTTYSIEELLADPVRLNSNLGYYTNFVNLMDLSAIAVPAGFRPGNGPKGGLPFGVTLVGPTFADGALAVLADRLHRAQALPIGATRHMPQGPALDADSAAPGTVRLAVVGAHLSGQPLNHQLTGRGARLVRTARTGSGYRLFALAGTTPAKPGLVRDAAGAGGIELEIWELTEAAFGSFVAEVPPPMAIGTLTLEDGTSVKGFLCEPAALAGAEDITGFGGWRRWLTR